jgi:MYXO-CTERM domain-containing protein
VTGLDAATKYYYRFSGAGATSGTGSFTTTPGNVNAAVKFAFSGDVDGLMRPYASVNNFQQNTPRDFFVFLGDTMYETGSTGSPAAASPTLGAAPGNLSTVLADYQKKYRENLQGVTAITGAPCSGGAGCSAQQGLQSLYAAQGNYTLLDNHELGNKQYINGGAPIAALSFSGNGTNATQLASVHNTTGTSINSTAGYQNFLQAYTDYQPIRVATGSDGLQKLYNTQNWGRNVSLTNVDDRSYRDVRLKTASGADETPSTTNAATGRFSDTSRTMLGADQLTWLQTQLKAQQDAGQVWKIVSVSSPIDQEGNDGGKSWFGGYQAERNKLFTFIADNKIDNVVFLSTDDHQTRVNQLWYTDVNDGKIKMLSNAFTIVTGPVGATGPDGVTNHSFSNLQKLSDAESLLLASENTKFNNGFGGNQLGLKDFGGRVTNVMRDHDGTLVAGSANDAVNFFSPDTFAYTNFDVDADGTLHVQVIGIDSYAQNAFPGTSPAARTILSFDVAAAVPEPSTWAMWLAGVVAIGAIRRKRVAATV